MNRLGLFDFVLEGATNDERMAWLTGLGFNAVEAMAPRVAADPADYRRACDAHDVAISCVTGVWLGDGVNPDAEARAKQVATHQQYIRLAAEMEAPRYIFVDHIPKSPTPRDLTWPLLLDTIGQLADTAQAEGVVIYIEAITRTFDPLLDTVQATYRFLRELNHPAVRMMVDSYHMAANGEAIEADTAAVWPLTGHVHVSDYQAPPAEPERPYPGDGQVDFHAYLRPIVAAGYAGPIIFEGNTVGDKAACLRRSREFIEGVLAEVRAAVRA